MHYAELFGKTRRDAPADITVGAQRLAFRAGLLRVLPGGALVPLPLAARVLAKMETALRGAAHELRAQELRPPLQPDLAALAAQEIQSYKHLPARLFWFDATRLRLVSLEAAPDAALETARRFDELATRFFQWAEVPFSFAEEVNNCRVWFAGAPTGDLELLRCSGGEYAATRAAARAHKPAAAPGESPLPLQEVETPHCDTIDSLAQFLGVPTARTAKAVFYSGGAGVIFAVVRGDLQIDEEKLKRVLGADKLRFATDREIESVGATPGYASPVGVRGATIIVDESVANSPNLVAGANRAGSHLLNTNVPRDYRPDLVADIALARAGDRCPDGDGTLELARGIRLGRSAPPQELEASFLDAAGRAQRARAVEIEIDLVQTMLAFLESHHDDKGVLWSRALAPLNVHVVALNADKPEVAAAVTRVTSDLEGASLEYLLDDRAESAGVKFNDADLIGLPVRLTLGPRTVAQNAVELKRRDEAAGRVVPLAELISNL